MKLYFSPLACSLSARIALYEAEALDPSCEPAEFVEVDTRVQRTSDGADYRRIHGLGVVPALELPGGERLGENAAILQFIAEAYPRARLMPSDNLGRARLQQWLSFVGTELHKGIYQPLLDPSASEAARAHALGKVDRVFGWLAEQLGEREFLLGDFSVADAYLSTVLNWSSVTPPQLDRWPNLAVYLKRLQARPSVARALAEELALYRARHPALPRAPLGTRELMERFNAAFQSHDPGGLEAIIAPDCVIENTHPAPDGARHEGRAACLALWSSIALARELRFEVERVEVFDDCGILAWRLHREGAAPLRGVNLMRTHAGLIVEARGYVKGA
ncbi:MAG TPA: nuclear transport factor 2 family protein [Polyangiaceae bacterium]|nr:nuclear transport factor 2 family protein [Polyangiaceae bacterium]